MTRAGQNGASASARRVFFDHGELKHVVLALIGEQPRHGYDIIRVIEQRTGGAYCPSPGVIYPTLSLLESLGHVRAAGADGPRNRYRVTADGRAFLADNKALVDQIFRRMQHVAAQASAPSAIVAAMDGLKAALHSARRPWSADEAKLVAAAIDVAAARIRGLATSSDNANQNHTHGEKVASMLQSEARVTTERASIYLQQLCKHFAHRLPVEFTPEQGQITFSVGTCRLAAESGLLTLRAEAEDESRLEQLQGVIEKHLLRFAFRDPPEIAWHAFGADPAT